MKARVLPLAGDEHSATQALLPWHVAGRLDAAEQARVAAHLAGCASCRAELAREQRLQALHAGIEANGRDANADWAALRHRLAPPLAPAAPPRHSWQAAAPWLRALVLAQAALLLGGLGLWLAGPFEAGPGRFVAQGAAGRDADVVVRFRPEAREEDIRRALRGCAARLVDGPTLSDAYLLDLPDGRQASALACLRADPQVLLAESLAAGVGR